MNKKIMFLYFSFLVISLSIFLSFPKFWIGRSFVVRSTPPWKIYSYLEEDSPNTPSLYPLLDSVVYKDTLEEVREFLSRTPKGENWGCVETEILGTMAAKERKHRVAAELPSEFRHHAFASITLRVSGGAWKYPPHFDGHNTLLCQKHGTRHVFIAAPRSREEQAIPPSQDAYQLHVLTPGTYITIPVGHWHYIENPPSDTWSEAISLSYGHDLYVQDVFATLWKKRIDYLDQLV